ncbi:MAG: ACP S-malonyltransferase [Anaerolineae bacterium]
MMDWASTAFVFAGQGSQLVGMGKDIAEAYPAARETFQAADDLLGFSLSRLCFEGPEDALNDTINTQPALYVYGIAVLRALQSECPQAVPAFLAGHSFGEVTALVAAGALSFEDGLQIVRERGRVMKAAGDRFPGAMAAILGLDADPIRDVCARAAAQTGGVLVLANDNCPGQNVISGDVATLDIGMGLAKEAGAKRIIKLAVSIASHSPLMQDASQAFHEALIRVPFQTPRIPVYANVTTESLHDPDAIVTELTNQLTHTVRWTESVRRMIAAGAKRFVEFGPKDVLSGLIKRIDGTVPATPLNNRQSLAGFVQDAS